MTNENQNPVTRRPRRHGRAKVNELVPNRRDSPSTQTDSPHPSRTTTSAQPLAAALRRLQILSAEEYQDLDEKVAELLAPKEHQARVLCVRSHTLVLVTPNAQAAKWLRYDLDDLVDALRHWRPGLGITGALVRVDSGSRHLEGRHHDGRLP